jgi:hypothetical protein
MHPTGCGLKTPGLEYTHVILKGNNDIHVLSVVVADL